MFVVLFAFFLIILLFMAFAHEGQLGGQHHAYREALTPELREAIFRRSQVYSGFYQCAYCGRVGGRYTGPNGEGWEVDHWVPVALGGRTIYSNLVLACRPCNQRKGVLLVPWPYASTAPDPRQLVHR